MKVKVTARPPRTLETDQFLKMVARMIHAGGKRAALDDPDLLPMLLELQRHVDGAVLECVRGLRDSGCTWETIGAACGTTRQAALMRWGRKV